MQSIYPYLSDDVTGQAAEPGSLLPSMPNILFPDFENVKTSTPAEQDAGADTQFIIDNLPKAAWAVSKILEADDRITRRSELAKDFKARIDRWLSSANQQDNDSISYLSVILEPFVKNEVSKLHKSKSISLPTGIASLRKQPDRLEILDGTEALAYCEAEHPEAVIVKKELDKSILKDLILRQTEPVPGVEATLGQDKLYIKPLI
jgi:phage host-nuclease inhibitor protein Gam